MTRCRCKSYVISRAKQDLGVDRALPPGGMRSDPQCERVLCVPRVGRTSRIRDVVGSIRLSPPRVKRLVQANGLVNARSGQAAPGRATPREGALHNQDVGEVGRTKRLGEGYFASAAAVLREAASLIIGVSFPINR